MRRAIKTVLLTATFLGGLGPAISQTNQPANPPLVTAPWSKLNPDIVVIDSRDQGSGATLLTVLPGAPPHSAITISSPQTGPVYLDVFDGTDNISIAHEFCDLINNNNVLKLGNIACQDSAPALGITNYAANIANVIPRTQGFSIQAGSPAWDAGPIFGLNRHPAGAVPPPGSSVGQIEFGGPSTSTPGEATVQYGMIQGRVVNPDINNLGGQLEFFTVKTAPGPFPGLSQAMNVWRGVQVCGVNGACPTDYGYGTISVPAYYLDGSGPGLFIGGRKVCMAPSGSYGPQGVNLAGYLYLAAGSACPGHTVP